MLVKHIRDAQNIPFATIVAVSPTNIGFAICNPKDRFNKKVGTSIAKVRANSKKAEGWEFKEGKVPNRYEFTNMFGWETVDVSLQEILNQELDIMQDRARRYFK